GLRACGDRGRLRAIRERVEPSGRHLRAPRVVHAREEHGLHDGSSSARSTTREATAGSVGTSHRNSAVAAPAPRSCATTKPGTSTGRSPANVLLKPRASVTAGLANDVDAVNQYAAVMYAPTANGTALARRRTHPQITESRPKVATNSLTS